MSIFKKPLWDGHQAALSLTFDDGRQCQLDFAIPEMDKRNIKGTFFLITNFPNEFNEKFDKVRWSEAVANGHEVGSHSHTHKKAEELDEAGAEYECAVSSSFLKDNLKITPTSFCYPYTDVNDALLSAVKTHYKQARGGRVARKDKYYHLGQGINFHNLTCFHVGGSNVNKNEIPLIVETAIARNAWVNLMFHTVGEEPKNVKPWDTLTVEEFGGILDLLLVGQRAGLWVAPFGTVAENFRGCL